MRAAALIATLLLTFVTAVAGDAASATKPTLRVLETSPLTVGGLSFKPRERIRVTATSEPGTFSRFVRSTRRGAFVVRFPELEVPCGGFVVRAVGAGGSRAAAKVPMPMCPPALTPS